MDTFRLTHIPESHDVDKVKGLFPEEDQSLIHAISLAASAYASDPPTKVATITFRKAPSFTKAQESSQQDAAKPKRQEIELPLSDLLEIEDPRARCIRIDNILEGLTPLHDPTPDENACTVE